MKLIEFKFDVAECYLYKYNYRYEHWPQMGVDMFALSQMIAFEI